MGPSRVIFQQSVSVQHHPVGMNDGQAGKAVEDPDVSDVGDPDAVRYFHVKLSVQCVVDNHRRLATITARSGL